MMRWFHIGVVAVFALAVLIFLLQNTQGANVSFLSLNMTWPLSIVVLVVYALGALTGGSLYALLRRSVRESRQTNA